MDGPGHITFGAGRSGSFQFGMVQGQRIDFTWYGFDEGTEHTGRGHAGIVAGELQWHLYFHLGNDSALRTVCQPTSARQRKIAK